MSRTVCNVRLNLRATDNRADLAACHDVNARQIDVSNRRFSCKAEQARISVAVPDCHSADGESAAVEHAFESAKRSEYPRVFIEPANRRPVARERDVISDSEIYAFVGIASVDVISKLFQICLTADSVRVT